MSLFSVGNKKIIAPKKEHLAPKVISQSFSFLEWFNKLDNPQYSFHKVRTRLKNPTDPNSVRIACEPYQILWLFNDDGRFDINGCAVKDDEGVAFRIERDTESRFNMTADDFNWDWIRVRAKDLVIQKDDSCSNRSGDYVIALDKKTNGENSTLSEDFDENTIFATKCRLLSNRNKFEQWGKDKYHVSYQKNSDINTEKNKKQITVWQFYGKACYGSRGNLLGYYDHTRLFADSVYEMVFEYISDLNKEVGVDRVMFGWRGPGMSLGLNLNYHFRHLQYLLCSSHISYEEMDNLQNVIDSIGDSFYGKRINIVIEEFDTSSNWLVSQSEKLIEAFPDSLVNIVYISLFKVFENKGKALL